MLTLKGGVMPTGVKWQPYNVRVVNDLFYLMFT